MDAREVTMHYKRKGDRVDEVLHDIVLNHVNRLEHENKRLREALESITEIELDRLATDVWSEASQMKRIARKALEGDKQ